MYAPMCLPTVYLRGQNKFAMPLLSLMAATLEKQCTDLASQIHPQSIESIGSDEYLLIEDNSTKRFW